MKKRNLIVVLFITIMVLFSAFCTFASADMGSPVFTEYLVTVNNPKGAKAKYSIWNSKLNKDFYHYLTIPDGTTLKVISEEYSKGKLLLTADYDDYRVSFSSNDVIIIKDSIGKSETRKIEEPFHLVVINEKGAALRKGPSEAYKEIVNIPYGTKITCDLMQKELSDVESWGYIEYKGYEGWIHLAEYGYGFDFAEYNTTGIPNEAMVIADGVRLSLYPDNVGEYSAIKDNRYVSKVIPSGTILKFDITYNQAKQFFALTEYNGVKGWLLAGEFYNGGGYAQQCAIKGTVTIISISKDKIKLFSKPYEKGEFLGEYLDYNVPIVADMSAYDYSQEYEDNEYGESYKSIGTYRVKINGKVGWVTSEYIADGVEETVFAGKDLKMYSEPDTKSKALTVIPSSSGFQIRCLGNKIGDDFYYFYITYNNKPGWVICSYKDILFENPKAETELAKSTTELSENNQNEILSEDNNTDITEKITTELSTGESVSEKTSPKSLIITCVSAAVIICISAVAVFVFINKKKKKNDIV